MKTLVLVIFLAWLTGCNFLPDPTPLPVPAECPPSEHWDEYPTEGKSFNSSQGGEVFLRIEKIAGEKEIILHFETPDGNFSIGGSYEGHDHPFPVHVLPDELMIDLRVCEETIYYKELPNSGKEINA